MKTKIVVKKKGREKERREIFGLVKWCIKFCLYTYCDSCIRALLLRMYRALATLPTTSIKAHAHVAATYSAPAPLRGPGSKRTESFLGGACTPATEKKIVTTFFPPVFLENEHTVHRLRYEERIYIYLPIFPINTKGKRGIKVTRRRRIFFFSPSKNRLKNPRKTKLLFSRYFP